MSIELSEALILFGRTLQHLLKESEGCCTEYEGVKYIVYKEENSMKIMLAEDCPELAESFEEGLLVWLHDQHVV